MTLKAYYDNIKAQTGKSPQDFKVLAEKKGLLKPGVKTSEIVSWLKQDFGLGHGHAMSIILYFNQSTGPKVTTDDRIDKLFSGARSRWRAPYEKLMKKVRAFGSDVTVSPTDTYLSLLRKNKKFSILQVTGERMDIGIKLRGAPTDRRFKPAGSWNEMVTHRVQVDEPGQIDSEVMSWLRKAYDKA